MTGLSDGTSLTPKTFGNELRQIREQADVTLADIAGETKVSVRILEALEDGQFKFLPERVFSRNFVRQYASLVGAESEEMAQAVRYSLGPLSRRLGIPSGAHS